MRILIVNKGLLPVYGYGGTERVIWGLGKALALLGHEVTYLVNPGSSCPFAKVIPIQAHQDILAQISNDYDVVHFNFTPHNIAQFHLPYLITIHGNARPDSFLDINAVFVSKNHAERHNSTCFVHNGLNWEDYPKPQFNLPRNHFHFLGKAAWKVKNVQGAIDVIKASKIEKLSVLGGKRFNFKMGMRFTLSSKIHFLGTVGDQDKQAALSTSKGLIFPIRWHEPFGLAIIESLFYGAPVFGTPYGSLPELITDEFGYLATSKKELSRALSNATNFEAKKCSDYAQSVYNSKNMALGYLAKYHQVIEHKKLNPSPPQLKSISTTKLLPWN